ncbi:MAG: class I SAM-dependent methyltransferase [Anaerolineales bacterium]
MTQRVGHTHSHQPETAGKVIHWAGIYDLFVNRIFGRRSHRKRVGALQLAGLKPGSSILDFGCGAGDLAFEAERLLGEKGSVLGIDPSPEMVKVARRKADKRKSGVEFKVESVEQMSDPNGSFDAVISSFVLHHLPEDLQTKAFKELKRVLKPGGLFFAIDIEHSKSLAGRLHDHLGGDMLHLSPRSGKRLPAWPKLASPRCKLERRPRLMSAICAGFRLAIDKLLNKCAPIERI